MRKSCLALVTALIVAGCGGEPAVTDNVVENMAVENAADATNFQAEVIALEPRAREGVFLRAVRDAGLPCQSVTGSESVEPRDGNPTWRATCDGNRPHLISITRDGTANIISRTDN